MDQELISTGADGRDAGAINIPRWGIPVIVAAAFITLAGLSIFLWWKLQRIGRRRDKTDLKASPSNVWAGRGTGESKVIG